MHPFSERLGEPVCQRLRHDAVVIVVLLLKFGAEFLHVDAGCHCKRADIIVNASLFRCDEIGEAQIRSSEGLRCLLAQVMKCQGVLGNGFHQEGRCPHSALERRIVRHVDFGVFADTVRGKNSDDSVRTKPLLFNDACKQCLCILKKFVRLLTDFRMPEQIREFAAQPPRRKKGSPIDIVNEFVQRIIVKDVNPFKFWFRRLIIRPIRCEFPLSRYRKRQQRRLLPVFGAAFPNVFIFGARLSREPLMFLAAQQIAHNTDAPRSILDMNRRALIDRFNLHRCMHL